MESLNALYAQLLGIGLVLVREALRTRDYAWAEAQVELLHNVPSLIGEANLERHRYFWTAERSLYLEWLDKSGQPEAKSKTATFYQSIWSEMEPIMADLLQPSTTARDGR